MIRFIFLKSTFIFICVFLLLNMLAVRVFAVSDNLSNYSPEDLIDDSLLNQEVAYDAEDGQQILYDSDGNLYQEFNVINKLLDGVFREYHSNGQLRYKLNFVAGRLNGPAKFYAKEGFLYLETTLRDSLFDGLIKGYYPSGVIAFEGMSEKGTLNGHYKQYTQEGALYKEIYFENGKREGMAKLYYTETKTIKTEVALKDGIPHGKVRTYYPDGSLKSEKTYVQGMLDGMAFVYDKNGNIQKESMFKDNKRIKSDREKIEDMYGDKGSSLSAGLNSINDNLYFDTFSPQK